MGKKILFCVSNDLSSDQRMIRICSSLSAAGYEVALIGRKLPDSSALQKRNFEQIRLYCFFKSGKMFYLEYNFRLLIFLLFRKTDAICAIDLDTILPAFLSSKIRNKICIYDAHEYFTEVPEVIRRPFVKQVWELVAKMTIPSIKYCYTVGNALAAELSKKYKVDFLVIRNVSRKRDSEIESELSNVPMPFILYQGAMNEGRGVHLAIEAMRFIEGYHLVLAGDGDLFGQLKKHCTDLGLDDRIKFLGKVSPERLAALTPKASLGLHLLENSGLSYYLSLANRTFDYIRAAVPAVHPDFPEYRNLIEMYKIGALLESYDPKLIAEQILNILANEEQYQFMKKECFRAAEDLCWENEEPVLINFYRHIFA